MDQGNRTMGWEDGEVIMDQGIQDIVLWNGFSGRLEMFRGDEDQAAEMADTHRETGDNVIYFFGVIKSVILREY